MISRRISPLILACLAATWFVWGSTYLAIRFALVSFPPFFQMGTRLLLAGILLIAWVWWRGQKLPTFTQWRNAALVGALMLGGNVGGVAFAEQSVASGPVVAFMAVTPALMTLASLPFGHQTFASRSDRHRHRNRRRVPADPRRHVCVIAEWPARTHHGNAGRASGPARARSPRGHFL
jgi:drug/metabolite transporter (DMT)-like permease